MRKILVLLAVCATLAVMAICFPTNERVLGEEGGWTGDIIVVNTTETYENPEYDMRGNISVSGGTLTLRNTNLTFRSDATNHFWAKAGAGSTLIMENVYLTTEEALLHPYLEFNLTILDSTFIVRNSTLAYPGWFTVRNSNVTIINSTITSRPEGGYAPLMFFESSSVSIQNSRIENYCEAETTMEFTPMLWPDDDIIVAPNVTVDLADSISYFYSNETVNLPTNRLSSAMLEITYTAEENYNGTGFVRWSKDGITFHNCSNPYEPLQQGNKREYEICPQYGGTKYDLWARGVRTTEDVKNMMIKFTNDDPEIDAESNVSFSSVKLVVSYENDIAFVNSTLYAFDTYMDLDFLQADVDPIKSGYQSPTDFLYLGTSFPEDLKDVYMEDSRDDHNVLRLLSNSSAYLYNVTVDMDETGGVVPQDGDPPFIAESASNIYIYRWVDIKVMDGNFLPLSNVGVSITQKGESVEPPFQVLDYMGKTSANYNITDYEGKTLIPLASDNITAPPSWPNSYIGWNYKLTGNYQTFSASKNISLPKFPLIYPENNTVKADIVFDQLYIDFFPVITVSNEEPVEGDVVWINITVYNNGTLDGENVEICFYIDGEIIGGYPEPRNISESSSISIPNTWTATSGWHTFYVVVDENNLIPEKYDDNNNDTKIVYVYTKPDLVPEDIAFSNSNPSDGDTVGINATIHNYGETNAACDVSFYYDEEDTGHLICIQSGLVVNANSTINVAGILWDTVDKPGSHTIYAVVENVVPSESDESNNVAYKSIVVRTKPDLTLSMGDITFTSEKPTNGTNVWVNATIHNVGETDAFNVTVKFFDGEKQIGMENISISLIAANSTEQVAVLWNATPAGSHIILIEIDLDGKIDESNENNNNASKIITVKTRPDLEVKSIVLSSYVEGSVTINASIRNNGGTDASDVKIDFYDNFNPIKTTTVSVPASNESIVSVIYTFTPGNHTVKVVIDTDNEIYEFNEGNNEKTEVFTIKTKPDLYINKIVFSNMNPIEGDIFNVTAYIYNNGEANATTDISFYWNGMLAAAPANIFVPGSGFNTTTIPFNTAGRPRIVTFNIKITNCVPSESNTNNNELSKSLSIYLSTFDWILDEDTEIDYDPLYTGHIVVKKAFTISNTSFTMQQSTDNQYHIIVLDNGRLIFENASLISDYALNIYLYDNASLTVVNSTLRCNIKGDTTSEIMLENSVVNGTFDIICDELVFVNSTLNGDLNIELSSVSITTSCINGSNNIESSVFYAENSNFTSDLQLGGTAHLINVTAVSVASKNGGVILRDWFAEINVKDGGNTPVENATIRIYFKTGGVFCANATIDKDGRAVIPLLAWNITSDGNKFMGVYNFTAEYRIANKSYNVSGDFDLWHNNTAVSAKFLETIIEPSSLLITIDEIPDVKAGETTNISGTIKYNLKNIPIENVTVTITVNGKTDSVNINPDGTYSKEITAPNKGGTYPVKITVVDHAYNLSPTEETAQLTVEGKPVPPQDYTSLIIGVVVAVVIIVIIGVICFIKREKIKPYLLILKAKIKKEEFIECGECGKKIPETFKKCPYCGAEFEEELVKCSECSAFIPASADKCPKCGALFEE